MAADNLASSAARPRWVRERPAQRSAIRRCRPRPGLLMPAGVAERTIEQVPELAARQAHVPEQVVAHFIEQARIASLPAAKQHGPPGRPGMAGEGLEASRAWRRRGGAGHGGFLAWACLAGSAWLDRPRIPGLSVRVQIGFFCFRPARPDRASGRAGAPAYSWSGEEIRQKRPDSMGPVPSRRSISRFGVGCGAKILKHSAALPDVMRKHRVHKR